MQSPPFPRYLVPPRSKYSPQDHVLEHPQFPFLSQCQRPSIEECTSTIKMDLRRIECQFVKRTELIQKTACWQVLVMPGIKLVGCVETQVFLDQLRSPGTKPFEEACCGPSVVTGGRMIGYRCCELSYNGLLSLTQKTRLNSRSTAFMQKLLKKITS